MFGIFDETIQEVPVLVASLNQWGATVESDRSALQEKVESGFIEITTAVLQIRGQVLTQGANVDEVRNHAIRLEQRVQQVEQVGLQAIAELAQLMTGYQHKFVEKKEPSLLLPRQLNLTSRPYKAS